MKVEEFIQRWHNLEGGAERANAQPFLIDLMAALDLPRQHPGVGNSIGHYRFEAPVANTSPYGSRTKGFIDLYKRAHFILEAKQSQLPEGVKAPNPESTTEPAPVPLDLFGNPDPSLARPAATPARSPARYDRLMRDAFDQARGYALSLPADHPTPPFLIVADIGRAFEIYFDWAGNGRGYGFFPNAAGYRITLDQLADPAIQTLLRQIWTEPAAADPRAQAIAVTREIATRLARTAAWLEKEQRENATLRARPAGAQVEETSLFIMRLLFCMFAEDVGLIPEKAFGKFLEDARTKSDDYWKSGLDSLWRAMGDASAGRYWPHGDATLRYFNGNLFADRTVLSLPREEKGELAAAAAADWRRVEPAIFGTFLEQALESTERGRLGAHYTPRAYVERLVEATIMDVLRPEWDQVLESARESADSGDTESAAAAVTAFLDRLAAARVLDPACGTGNFLYVAMEQLLRLESKALDFLAQIGRPATPRVGPHQFLGLELNPRAAVIAEIVCWIGWLRFRLEADPEAIPDPVLQQTAAINFGRHGGYDACLALNEFGSVDFGNVRASAWPEAEFIVGNPPFIGGKDLRAKLASGYAEALWKANPRVPPSADFVMQWWDRAAETLLAPGTKLRRFGFVTTNSITQSFSRRVIEARLAKEPATSVPDSVVPAKAGTSGRRQTNLPANPTVTPGLTRGPACLSLTYAIPDHPWTRATKDAAAVRIAMTVAELGHSDGRLLTVVSETGIDTDTPEIGTAEAVGRINADLTVGTDVGTVMPLKANEAISSRGVALHGAGFIVTPEQAVALGLGRRPGLETQIRPYRNGRDLLGRPRGVMVIDVDGMDVAEVRQQFPEVYQHLWATVKPERDANREPSRKKLWWMFGRRNTDMRSAIAGLPRYIATVETAKHRIFHFLDADILPDNMLVAIGSDNAFHLGVLSSHIHCEWVLVTGGWLGFGNDNRYSKSKVFDPFPFPDATPAQQAAIARTAEEIERTRAAVLAENPGLTLTAIYNEIEKLRAGEPLTDTAIAARAGILFELHSQLDSAVAAAYGWPWPLPVPEIIARLVALNAERAAEEAAGKIRWLRPDYQASRIS